MTEARATTVLIVDDDEDLRDTIALSLKLKGFQTLTADGGRAALKIVISRPIDVLISDVRMPDGDGIELLKAVKGYNFDIPVVIFVTGFSDLSLEEAYDLGAEVVMSKPFETSHLIEAVKKAAGARDARWRSNRSAGDLSIELDLPASAEGATGRIFNLGRVGMFIRLGGALPKPGSTIGFKLRFGDDIPGLIEGKGVVRWVRDKDELERPRGCGIEFTFLEEASRSNVFRLLNVLKLKSYIPRD